MADYSAHGVDDTNVSMLTGPRKKRPAHGAERAKQAPVLAAAKLSRAKAKRLERFREKMRKQEERKSLMETLSKSMLRPEETALYQSSSRVGRKETAKQRLHTALLEERAGIAPSAPTTVEVEVDETAVEWVPAPEQKSRAERKRERAEAAKAKEAAEEERGEEQEQEEPAEVVEKHRAPSAKRSKLKGFFGTARGADDDERDDKWHEEQRQRLEAWKKSLGMAAAPAPAPAPAQQQEQQFSEEWGDDQPVLVDTRPKAAPLAPLAPLAAKARAAEEPGKHVIVAAAAAEAAGKKFGFGFLPGTTVVAASELPKPEEEEQQQQQQHEAEEDSAQDPSATPAPEATSSEQHEGEEDKEESAESGESDESEEEEAEEKRKRRRPKPLVWTQRTISTVVNVGVHRPEDVEKSRQDLPIIMEEQAIVESVRDNEVSILCGETGCGKTTQVPQFLYEAGYGSPSSPQTPGLIGITQPRRVAAVSMATRVAYELGLTLGKEVAYQIRYDSIVDAKQTRIKFMTDGVLLREIQNDFALSQYSAIVIDEAHERNINTDVLIGLLSRIVPLRNRLAREGKPTKTGGEPAKPLRLIIMSATLRVEDFTKNSLLFPRPPPTISVAARQFPVTIHFNRKTVLDDYVGEVFSKVCKIHTRLPAGGVLVFLTGQQEILHLCHRLRKRFPSSGASLAAPVASNKRQRPPRKHAAEKKRLLEQQQQSEATQAPADIEEADASMLATVKADAPQIAAQVLDEDGEADVVDGDVDEDDEDDEDELDDLNAEFDGEIDGEDDDDEEVIGENAPLGLVDEHSPYAPVHVLPLFSTLDPERQRRVFEGAPEGARLVVVATNVAETALTIPGITYVVDCGRSKQKVFDKATGISSFAVDWISKASADQRAGRAGRTCAGHCYRVYSSAVYNDQFDKFSEPEILRTPIEGVCLQMKVMGIDGISSFPFPTPPSAASVRTAMGSLRNLGAVDAKDRITALGRRIAQFPVHPRYAKMLVLAHQAGCLQWVVTIVAAMSVKQLFLPMLGAGAFDDDDAATAAQKRDCSHRKSKSPWASSSSDCLAALKAVEACLYSKKAGQSVREFCERHQLHMQSMEEALRLREQLASMLSVRVDGSGSARPPTTSEEALIRQVVCAGLIDQVARRVPPEKLGDWTRTPSAAYTCAALGESEPVFIHSTSYVRDAAPEYVVYHEITRTASGRAYMHGVTSVHPAWLVSLSPASLISVSKPLALPPPRFDQASGKVKCFVRATLGRGEGAWTMPMQLVTFPDTQERYRYFAQFVLQGLVAKKLAAFNSYLVGNASSVARTASAKVIVLLDALIQAGVDSRAALFAKWKSEPKFLLKEYLQFVDESKHAEVTAAWPPRQ
eukprot:m51a1_g11249 putative probable atp-dependent rna helicase dhx37 (1362) ;mRNA; r:32915-37814